MKKKPIILEGAEIDQRPFGPYFKLKTEIRWIGDFGNAYLRFEDLSNGRYLGSLENKDIRRLMNWCKQALGEK